jgi:signal peptidase II
MQRSSGANSVVFWPVLAAIVAADVGTKWWALKVLPQHSPVDVIDGWLRWTLVFNPGAAFGLSVGSPGVSRWLFMALTIIALGILSRLYVATKEDEVMRTLSLAFVCAGAIGNLIDRIRWNQGVVDFIDVGWGASRWPTFNVADMAVSVGAFLLAWVLWEEEREPAIPTAAVAPSTAPTPVAAVATDGVEIS